jgi:hypothetical protein
MSLSPPKGPPPSILTMETRSYHMNVERKQTFSLSYLTYYKIRAIDAFNVEMSLVLTFVFIIFMEDSF